MHSEIALEDDVQALLREHEELARLLSDDAEAGRCEMGARLFEELASLRDRGFSGTAPGDKRRS